MAPRKKKPEEATEATEVMEVTAMYEGTCVDCRFFSETPDWMGAHCGNPVSPNHNARVKEYGTCMVGDYKYQRPIAPPKPPKETVVVDSIKHEGDIFEDTEAKEETDE